MANVKSNELVLVLKPIGKNGLGELRNKLDKFVESNWGILQSGAVVLEQKWREKIEKEGKDENYEACPCKVIWADYYAPNRIQIGKTRLHAKHGLKYADGHKYNDPYCITEEQLKNTVLDLQTLLNAAAKDTVASFDIIIIKN